MEILPPLARKGDPDTSHIAADKLKASGKWKNQKAMLLAWLRENRIDCLERSMTASEIASASGIRHPVCHKRLPDLRKEGLVGLATRRTCQVTGEQAWTWRATSEEERQLLRELAEAIVGED